MSDFARTLTLSPSTAEDFQTCELKYYHSQVRRLRMPQTQAQKFGEVMHTGFDTYYDTRSVDAAVGAIERAWPGDLTEDKGRSLERAVKVMKMYADKWEYDGIETVRPSDKEVVFVPLPGTPWRVSMKLDRVVKWDRTYRVMEHKTTSQLTVSTLDRYNPNLQIRTYVWGARRMGLPISGAIAGALMDITCVNVQKIDFKRDVVSVTEAQDTETEVVLRRICQQILDCETAGFTPNWGACTQYGECAYRPIDKHSPELRESIIREKYADGTGTGSGEADLRGTV